MDHGVTADVASSSTQQVRKLPAAGTENVQKTLSTAPRDCVAFHQDKSVTDKHFANLYASFAERAPGMIHQVTETSFENVYFFDSQRNGNIIQTIALAESIQ